MLHCCPRTEWLRCCIALQSTLQMLTCPPPAALPLQRQQLEADGKRLQGEYESLVAAQQERAAEWEAAAQREQAALDSRKQVRPAVS